MPSHDIVFRLEMWLLLPLLVLLLAAAAEIGFRLARRNRDRDDPHLETHATVVQGALLGLLALLLGFTFSLASGRFELRQHLVVDESNAIGTTWLRAQLLDEPRRTVVLGLLRKYVDARLNAFAPGISEQRMTAALRESDALQTELWAQTSGLDRQNSTAVTTLFITTLNEMIDLGAKRLAARRNRVPQAVLLLLLLVSMGAVGFVGYGSGFAARREYASAICVILMVTSVILMIVDLDRPRRGFIRVSEQAMFDLRATMDAR